LSSTTHDAIVELQARTTEKPGVTATLTMRSILRIPVRGGAPVNMLDL